MAMKRPWTLTVTVTSAIVTASFCLGDYVLAQNVNQFSIYNNVDFSGDKVSPWIYDFTLEKCRASCSENGTCRAFTFNTQRRVCILKSGVGEPSINTDAISGAIVPVVGVDFDDGDLDEQREVSIRQCQDLCIKNDNCKGFSFVTAKSWCFLKDRIVSPTRNKNVVSWIKQAAQAPVQPRGDSSTGNVEAPSTSLNSPQVCKNGYYCASGSVCIDKDHSCLSSNSPRVCSDGKTVCDKDHICFQGECVASNSPRVCSDRRHFCEVGYDCTGENECVAELPPAPPTPKYTSSRCSSKAPPDAAANSPPPLGDTIQFIEARASDFGNVSWSGVPKGATAADAFPTHKRGHLSIKISEGVLLRATSTHDTRVDRSGSDYSEQRISTVVTSKAEVCISDLVASVQVADVDVFPCAIQIQCAKAGCITSSELAWSKMEPSGQVFERPESSKSADLVYFILNATDYCKRMKKALEHLITLQGGQGELFKDP